MKIKSFLALLLAAGMIVLGALLPAIAADRQDAANDNQVLFAPVNAVRLEFAQEEITLSQTVALVGKSQEVVVIPDSLTSLGQDKAEAAAIAVVERYQQEGVLFQNAADRGEVLYCQPVLIYGKAVYGSSMEQRSGTSGDNRQCNIFWDVTYGSQDDGYYFHITIDDRTGMVCSIEYTDGENTYQRGDMEFVLSAFCDRYITDLGEEFYWCEVSDIVKKATSPFDGSYLASDISWNDAVYGTCKITFFVSENGFYTNIQ